MDVLIEPQIPAHVVWLETLSAEPALCGVYAIKNIISCRVYVGSSNNIPKRLREHFYKLRKGNHHSPTLQRSWAKHGPLAFRVAVLEVVADTSSLFTREQVWMGSLHGGCPVRGMNAYPIAGGPRGHKATPETKAKMSAAKKGRPGHWLGKKFSDETKAKMSAARAGKKRGPMSDEQKAKLRATAILRVVPRERILKLADFNRGKPLTEETKAKMSATKKGKRKSPEHRAKISATKLAQNRRRRAVDGALTRDLFD